MVRAGGGSWGASGSGQGGSGWNGKGSEMRGGLPTVHERGPPQMRGVWSVAAASGVAVGRLVTTGSREGSRRSPEKREGKLSTPSSPVSPSDQPAEV